MLIYICLKKKQLSLAATPKYNAYAQDRLQDILGDYNTSTG